jgi:two-component system chemotaxis response regulator CheB
MKQNISMQQREFEAIVIGASAGGLNAFFNLFEHLPSNFPIPIIVVQHLHPQEDSVLPDLINSKTKLNVKEVVDKEEIHRGFIYFAPPNYHLLIEDKYSFSLTYDEKVNYSRPSIDVLFESASHVWAQNLIGIILTGANGDGAEGIKLVAKAGGTTIAQSPDSSEFPVMPQAAINTGFVQHILTIEQMVDFLINLSSMHQTDNVLGK